MSPDITSTAQAGRWRTARPFPSMVFAFGVKKGSSSIRAPLYLIGHHRVIHAQPLSSRRPEECDARTGVDQSGLTPFLGGTCLFRDPEGSRCCLQPGGVRVGDRVVARAVRQCKVWAHVALPRQELPLSLVKMEKRGQVTQSRVQGHTWWGLAPSHHCPRLTTFPWQMLEPRLWQGVSPARSYLGRVTSSWVPGSHLHRRHPWLARLQRRGALHQPRPGGSGQVL